MLNSTLIRSGLALLILASLIAAIGFTPQPVAAQSSYPCSSTYRIDVTLPNGARWDMCWEERNKEGIVLRHIYYTPAGGTRRMVLWQASVAEVFVPYDKGSPRFYDLSGYGLGGGYLVNLPAAECPGGTLISNGVKNVICRQIQDRGYAYKYTTQRQGKQLKLFSVAGVGNYYYIVSWTFFDNGVIVPAIQATGALYSTTGGTTYGWPIGPGNTNYNASHVHTYYWRLDFDLGGASNDRLEQIEFTGSGNTLRPIATTSLTTESKQTVNATQYRFWRVRDTAINNADSHNISYEIQPQASHVFRSNSASEQWSLHDIHLTQHSSCERLVANNTATYGCGNGLLNFVNGQAVTDAVVWVGVSYHHVPRDEDHSHIQADHYSSIELVPRDWHHTSP